MPPIDRIYAGAAVQTTASGLFSPTVPGPGQTFSVADATGWPTTGEFPVKLNRGLSDQEHILCTRVDTTFTVVSRGYDGTSAQSHDNPTVEIYFDARSANLIVDHVDGNEVNPHSGVLLNNAAHDIEARHTFGAAYGTPATPTALTPDIAGAAGSGNNPAREDHAHNVPTDVAVTSGLANAEGNAATFARSNHTHDQAALSVGTAEQVDLSTTTAKIDNLAVTQGKLATPSVGTAQILDVNVTLAKMAHEAPTAYTPTWAASGTPPSIGNGTLSGEWYRLGQIILFTVTMQGGTTTNYGTGTWEFGLPAATAWGGGFPLPSLTVMNNSGTRFIGINIRGTTDVTFRILERITLNDAGNTSPFTWGTSDFLQVSGMYFAAT